MMSLEVHGIIRYMAASGFPFRVTDIDTPGVHVAGSYHYAVGTGGVGLAVDFAGPTPSLGGPDLKRIVDRFLPVKDQLAEFLHPWNRQDHRDHVHVAVHKGTILQKEYPMPDPVSIPEHLKIVSAFPYEGGYVVVIANGDIYCYNCTFRGHPTWTGTEWRP